MTETPTGSDPTRVVEVERKYDVDDGTPLPEWRGVPGVDAVSAGELRELDARYLDTSDADFEPRFAALLGAKREAEADVDAEAARIITPRLAGSVR